jgi:hypothetical protein
MKSLEKVLRASVAKNGTQPLTTQYLLNIVIMANRLEDEENEAVNNDQARREKEIEDARMQDFADQCGDR